MDISRVTAYIYIRIPFLLRSSLTSPSAIRLGIRFRDGFFLILISVLTVNVNYLIENE